MDSIQLTILPSANALQITHNIRLLLAPDLLQILISGHFPEIEGALGSNENNNEAMRSENIARILTIHQR